MPVDEGTSEATNRVHHRARRRRTPLVAAGRERVDPTEDAVARLEAEVFGAIAALHRPTENLPGHSEDVTVRSGVDEIVDRCDDPPGEPDVRDLPELSLAALKLAALLLSVVLALGVLFHVALAGMSAML